MSLLLLAEATPKAKAKHGMKAGMCSNLGRDS